MIKTQRPICAVGSELPFLTTDRSVLNLPSARKSLTFRVVGITRYGRRILEFDFTVTDEITNFDLGDNG